MNIWKISLLALTLPLTGCLPEVSYPDEPVIDFLSFIEHEDGSATLSLSFTDGDGDLGLDGTDILPPFCPTCEHYYNLKCEYDELRNKVWTHIELNPLEGQVPFYYRVPRVEPSGENPALNGVIDIAMNTWSLLSEYDTLRFRITLEDRALNLSSADTSRIILK
jgi:hypothetical protein